MIVWIIAALTVITALCWFLISNRPLRLALGGLTGLALVAAVGLLSANMDSHYGMEQQTTVTTKPVYSMAPSNMPIGMIATKKVGPNNLVVVYKDHASDEKATAHFVPDTSDIVAATKQTSDYQQTNGDQAVVKTTTTKWVYKSQLLKDLFHEEGQDNTIHVSHVVEIPTSWRVVSQ